MRRASLLFLVVGLGCVSLPVQPAGAAQTADINPYRGLGAWVDSFDYAPRLHREGRPPPVTADSVNDIARLGARTLYLQVANPDDAPTDQLVDAVQIRAILSSARSAGIRVVAWFLPHLANVEADTQMIKTIVNFRSEGARFDTVALDLEYTQGESDVAIRNDNMIELTRNARKILGTKRGLGAIVYPAVQIDVVNPFLWPNFPYKRLAPMIDVWMPMAYFTFRDQPYRDAYRYTEESVARLRKHLDDKSAVVHPIGGIADLTTPEDYVAFLRAVGDTKSVGYSVYDFVTTSSSAWTFLRGSGVPA
ncbi:MAG: hypothetical protein WEB19_03110 [Acidimicrobiia bacterium]